MSIEQEKNSAPSTETPLPINGTLNLLFSQGGKIALALAAAGLAISSLTEQQPTNVGASSKDTPTPTPLSKLSAEGLPSQRLYNQTVRQVDEFQGKETVQINPSYIGMGRIEFDIGNDHYIWNVSGAYFGIYPPNDSSIRTGTVWVGINGILQESKAFQGLQSLAPHQPLMAQGIGGIAIDIPLDKYYLSEAVLRGDGNYDPYFESGTDIKNAEKYLGRTTQWKGLPQGGLKGYNKPITLGADADGNYANITYLLNYPYTDQIYLTDCIIVTECGTYQIRRDSLGHVIGDTFIKLADATPTVTSTQTATEIPSSTATKTATVTPTSTATPYNTATSTATHQVFRLNLPIINNSQEGK